MTDHSRRPAVVVIAEDEILIRMDAALAFTEAGFVVLEAEQASEVLLIMADRAVEVCLLFTDVHMPGGMDGLALAHHVRQNWSWIGLLIASGRARPSAAQLPNGSRFISKPYDLAHAVRHAQELAAAA